MPTFKDLTGKFESILFRKTVFEGLVNYLEANFLGRNGNQASQCMLTENKVKIPEGAIEMVVVDLAAEIDSLEKDLAMIAAMEVQLPENPEGFLKKSKKSQKPAQVQGD